MKPKVATFCRRLLWIFVFIFCLRFWAEAQTTITTNAVSTLKLDAPATGVQIVPVEKKLFVTFGLDRFPAFRRSLGGIELWVYIASLIYILGALIASKILDYVTRAYLKKWAARTETKLDDIL